MGRVMKMKFSGLKVNVIVKFANQVRVSWLPIILADTDDPSYSRAIGILDPAQQESKLCYDMPDYGYTSNQNKSCIAQSKARKYKAFKRTKQFYEMFPKIIRSKPRKTLVKRMQITTRTTHIPDPTATIWRQYLINLRKKALEEGIPQWFDVVGTSLELLFKFVN